MGIECDIPIFLFWIWTKSKAAHCLWLVWQMPSTLRQVPFLATLASISHLLPSIIASSIFLRFNLFYHFLWVVLRIGSILTFIQVSVQGWDTLSYDIRLSLCWWFVGENFWDGKITYRLAIHFLPQLRFICTFSSLIAWNATLWWAAFTALRRSLLWLI